MYVLDLVCIFIDQNLKSWNIRYNKNRKTGQTNETTIGRDLISPGMRIHSKVLKLMNTVHSKPNQTESCWSVSRGSGLRSNTDIYLRSATIWLCILHVHIEVPEIQWTRVMSSIFNTGMYKACLSLSLRILDIHTDSGKNQRQWHTFIHVFHCDRWHTLKITL